MRGTGHGTPRFFVFFCFTTGFAGGGGKGGGFLSCSSLSLIPWLEDADSLRTVASFSFLFIEFSCVEFSWLSGYEVSLSYIQLAFTLQCRFDCL